MGDTVLFIVSIRMFIKLFDSLQRHKGDAPPCLTLQHFTELKDEKGY